MNIRPLVAMGLSGGCIALAVLSFGDAFLIDLRDLPAFLIVFLGTILFVVAHFSISDIAKCGSLAFLKQPTISSESRKRSLYLLSVATRAALGFGILGFFVGQVLLLRNLSNPDMIGPAIASSFISVIYAVSFAEITIHSLRIQIERHTLAASENGEDREGQDSGRAYVVGLLLVMLIVLPLISIWFSFFGWWYQGPFAPQ